MEINEVVKKFLASPPKDLIREFRQFVIHEPIAKNLLIEICTESLERGARPSDLAGFSLMYGMAIGVMLERHRTSTLDKES
jgi:hypothetical protein